MKTQKIVGYFCAVAMCTLSFTSCKDDTAKPTVKTTVEPNELQAPSAASYTLLLEDKDKTFETFKWTAPDFGFTSLNFYKLQMDKESETFAKPIEVASVSGVLSASITVGAMNDKLLGMGLAPQSPAKIKLRVVSSVNDKVSTVVSSVKTITVTPYATTFPSIWGMGDALNGWGPWPTAAVEVPSTQYKKYGTIAYLINGKIFRFFEQQDWGPTGYNYLYFTSVDSKLALNPGDGDNNFKVVGATGWYTITMDLLAKTISLAATSEPTLFMTGDALNGWGWTPGQYVKMAFIKPGVFESTSTFKVQTFRFFAQPDWSPTSYNYPFFTTVDNKFENANDGDKNFKFVGTPGPYKIRVDLNAKTIVH